MSSPLKLSVMADTEGEPAGYDSAIVSVPAGWYATVEGDRAFLAQLAGRELRKASELMAANLGEKLHHAEWTITGDQAEVKTLGLMHDCAACRAGVGQALAFLRDNPDGEVVVGSAVSGQWEHSGSQRQWELVVYREDVPRQITNRIVGATVTDEFIANVASPALAAAHLFSKIGSVPPPLAEHLPPHDPSAVIYEP